MIQMLDQMNQPSPEAQQMQMMQQQAQMAQAEAQVNVLNAQAQKYSAEAQQTAVDTELAPTIAQAKLTAALSTNLDNDNEQADFERRAKIAELMIKEEELKIKKMDIDSNERIANTQMESKNKSDMAFSSLLGE
jgi:DnaJ-domain-containing protein 1